MQTASSTVRLSPASDIIDALQNSLTRSQAITPDLETTYPRFTNDPIIESKDRTVSAITERQQQLDAVLHEFLDLETVMDFKLHHQLVEKKDKITQSMNLPKELVSTHWRLPTEVLSQIFVHCLPETSHFSPAPKLAPVLLTRICRRWRDVAVAMPSLWCRLELEVDHSDWQQQAFCYDSWLKRSQGRPLSFAFKCYIGQSTKLRRLLQPYRNQISSLSIRSYCGVAIPEPLLINLPALQELAITIHSHDRITNIAHSISTSQLRFTLRSLKVIGSMLGLETLSSFNPIWTHLKNVEIATRHADAFIQLLHLCPDLSSLTIHAHFDQKQAVEPFTHSKLQSLRISFSSAPTNRLHDLFNALTLPNLRVLEAGFARAWPHEEFKALLTRSNCPLESLIFSTGVITTDKQRTEYIALIPSLEVVVNPKRYQCFNLL
ncbi:uncharacterized protein EDB91DRAFT_1198424 [Suillus paluster]|uniref:uncharacterized protein n=1 Tax=Suillus paluster TaxID=48578 RepID=UPI001B8733E4|nr:uncharacterized protein EDB91DRAFT_1198424 [Suillus paluster]KAG1747911.1 hypothetical protein EDB91DRAFT_1198424 [Suillus paluster]